MTRVDEALEILTAFGLPRMQQNERSAITLLALAGLGRNGSWATATSPLHRVWDIMRFMREEFGKNYAANTRETIRRQTLHQFEQARIVDRNPDDPSRPTNSGKNCYALTREVAVVLRAYGTPDFNRRVAAFINKFGSLQEAYNRKRKSKQVQLVLPGGQTIGLSPGKHNALQASVVQEFGPRFAPGAQVLYVGDTAKKQLICDKAALAELRVPITEHDKLPDVVLYDKKRKWLFLVEAVTSHGPVSPKRHHELERVLVGASAQRVYVTAFLTTADFRKHAADIAWETEVWIAEHPDHMIHFNGPKFLGPFAPRGKRDQ